MPDLVALRLTGERLAGYLEKVWGAGDAALPLDPAMRPSEMKRLLAATRPAALITAGGAEGLPDPVPAADGVALVVMTSGTTGEPKGVELSHDALKASARASLDRLGAAAGDRWLACLPLHHIAGLSILTRSRLLGTAPVVHGRFDVDAFEAERDATLVSLVPTMLRRLLDAGADLARFKAVLLGGAAPALPLVRGARRVGANLVVTYGMTETCGGCVYDGRPLDGVEVCVGPEGGIAIRGPILMNGYRLDDDLTRAVVRDGWFHTSDAGIVDGGGTVRVLGRIDDMIVSGGKNVAPAEVEAALNEHPGIADAAVTSEPDEAWGERVVALVVAAAGRVADAGALQAFLRERLAAYKIPKEIRFVPEIPRTRAGKVSRAGLRRLG